MIARHNSTILMMAHKSFCRCEVNVSWSPSLFFFTALTTFCFINVKLKSERRRLTICNNHRITCSLLVTSSKEPRPEESLFFGIPSIASIPGLFAFRCFRRRGWPHWNPRSTNENLFDFLAKTESSWNIFANLLSFYSLEIQKTELGIPRPFGHIKLEMENMKSVEIVAKKRKKSMKRTSQKSLIPFFISIFNILKNIFPSTLDIKF